MTKGIWNVCEIDAEISSDDVIFSKKNWWDDRYRAPLGEIRKVGKAYAFVFWLPFFSFFGISQALNVFSCVSFFSWKQVLHRRMKQHNPLPLNSPSLSLHWIQFFWFCDVFCFSFFSRNVYVSFSIFYEEQHFLRIHWGLLLFLLLHR